MLALFSVGYTLAVVRQHVLQPAAQQLQHLLAPSARDVPTKQWDALGNTSWWLPFIDGWSHEEGPYHFDGTNGSKTNGEDGAFILHVSQVYNELRDQLGVGWTASRMAYMNSVLRGNACGDASLDVTPSVPAGTECPEAYTDYLPRTEFEIKGGAFATAQSAVPWIDTEQLNISISNGQTSKPKLVEDALSAYAAALGGKGVVDSTALRLALGHVLVPLATLFATLAELHPFRDANSRTRNFVLQSEMTRLGGHPMLLWDVGWQIYGMGSVHNVTLFLLRGWCAWEFALANGGQSPYAHLLSLSHIEIQTNQTDPDYTRKAAAQALSIELYDETQDR